MKQKPYSAASFRDPLLRALGSLTGFQAGIPIKLTDTYPLICAEMGFADINACGQQNAANKPWIAQWIGWAFTQRLVGQGLGESGGRGRWQLTVDGVKQALILTPEKHDSQKSHAASPELIETNLPSIVVAAFRPDLYIQGLLAASSPCVSHFTNRSVVCQTCPIQTQCLHGTSARLSEIAAEMRKQKTQKPTRIIPETHQTTEPILIPSNPSPPQDTLEIIVNTSSGQKCRACSRPLGVGDFVGWYRPSKDNPKSAGLVHLNEERKPQCPP